MALRRMLSTRLTSSARFLKMSISAQALYFHLNMHADDDGVVEAYTVLRSVGCSEDDLKLLDLKGFVKVLNEDLVTFIIDWQENNLVRADRKTDSLYKDLLLEKIPDIQLLAKKQRSDVKNKIVDTVEKCDNQAVYEILPSNTQTMDSPWTDNGQSMDGQWTDNGRTMDSPWTEDGQHRLGKDRLSKDILIYTSENDENENPNPDPAEQAQRVHPLEQKLVDLYHEKCPSLPKVKKLTDERRRKIRKMFRRYTLDDFSKAFEIAENSPFMRGEVKSPGHEGWIANFDYFLNENKLIKTLEGTYSGKSPGGGRHHMMESDTDYGALEAMLEEDQLQKAQGIACPDDS